MPPMAVYAVSVAWGAHSRTMPVHPEHPWVCVRSVIPSTKKPVSVSLSLFKLDPVTPQELADALQSGGNPLSKVERTSSFHQFIDVAWDELPKVVDVSAFII